MPTGTVYGDILQSSDLPDTQRVIFSRMLEFTARPILVTDQPAFVEEWPEFGAKRGQVVTRTVFHQLARSIAPLVENQDVTGGSVADHQVSFRINEYGDAIGTTEFVDLTSYFGPVSDITTSLLGPQMALSQDTVARNTLWYGAPGFKTPRYKTFANKARADRQHITSSDVLTSDMVRQIAYRLGVRLVPIMGAREPSFVCIAHPSATYDLKNDSLWKDAQLYAGSTRLFNGEEGMLHGVRFIKSTEHRIANGGALVKQTTLAAGTYKAGTLTVTVADATNLTVGMEVSLHATGDAVTAPPAAGGGAVSWTAPNGKDPVEEALLIEGISGNTLTFMSELKYTHAGGEYCTEAIDIYPLSFIGGLAPMGKGVALEPEVRVALPTDKLRRMSYVGWYGIFGYGIVRDWAYEITEVAGTLNEAPAYPA